MKKCHKGSLAEEAAENYLQKKDYLIVARNFSCCYGEIDIIAEKDDVIAFVEVRSRRRDMDAAFSSVSVRKRLRLIRSAVHFLQNNTRFEDHCMRFDVIGAVTGTGTGLYRIEHIEDAFRVENLDEYL